MPRLKTGQAAPELLLPNLELGTVDLEDHRGTWTLVSFHRYAACPVCNVTLQSFRKRYDELQAAGLQKVAVFHSPPEKMNQFMQPGDFPFEILMDPEQVFYKTWGIEAPLSALANPMSALAAMKTLGKTWFPDPTQRDVNLATCPADFIVDPDGVLKHVHYGSHIGDSLSVDAVMSIFRDWKGAEDT